MAHVYMIILGVLHLVHLAGKELFGQNPRQRTMCITMEVLIGVVYIVGGWILVADLLN